MPHLFLTTAVTALRPLCAPVLAGARVFMYHHNRRPEQASNKSHHVNRRPNPHGQMESFKSLWDFLLRGGGDGGVKKF